MYKVTNIANNRAKNGANFRHNAHFGSTATAYDIRMEPWIAGKLLKLNASIRITDEVYNMSNTQVVINLHKKAGVVEVEKLAEDVPTENLLDADVALTKAIENFEEIETSLQAITQEEIPQIGDEDQKPKKHHKKGSH